MPYYQASEPDDDDVIEARAARVAGKRAHMRSLAARTKDELDDAMDQLNKLSFDDVNTEPDDRHDD